MADEAEETPAPAEEVEMSVLDALKTVSIENAPCRRIPIH